MAHRQGLNDVQTALLRWIGDGCPAGVHEGEVTHRIVAAALRRRGLVTVTGRGPTWKAALTDEGRIHLERVGAGTAPPQRQENVSVTDQLITELVAAGGSKTFHRAGGRRGSVDYERRAALAVRYGKVPAGRRLVVRRLSWQEVEISLVDAPAELRPPAAIAVPDHVSRFHPVVAAFRKASDCHEVSRAQLPRASRLLQALVTEAERRGHTVAFASDSTPSDRYERRTGSSDGHLIIKTAEYDAHIRISEEGVPSRFNWVRTHSAYNWTPSGGYESTRISLSDYEANATGRLCLELCGYDAHQRVHRWADRQRHRLDDKLGDLLYEIELRSLEAGETREEEERRQVEREQAWRLAIDRATTQAIEQQHVDALLGQIDRWERAERIRAWCSAAEPAATTPSATDWLKWARNYADTIDSALNPQPPVIDENPTGEDLRPFLAGWDPYRPPTR
jgi:hypothetical protein